MTASHKPSADDQPTRPTPFILSGSINE